MKRKQIAEWPADAPSPEELARRVSYVGSPEHKGHPSPAGSPKLRHNDASRCDEAYADFTAPMQALRESVQAMRTSQFVGQYPKYVWGRLDGALYEARLVNHELGQYKAYRLGSVQELPDDPLGRLDAIADV